MISAQYKTADVLVSTVLHVTISSSVETFRAGTLQT